MTWLPLESQMFLSVAYDADKRILYLRFRSGDVYRYFQFSHDDYQVSVRRAPSSKGQGSWVMLREWTDQLRATSRKQ